MLTKLTLALTLTLTETEPLLGHFFCSQVTSQLRHLRKLFLCFFLTFFPSFLLSSFPPFFFLPCVSSPFPSFCRSPAFFFVFLCPSFQICAPDAHMLTDQRAVSVPLCLRLALNPDSEPRNSLSKGLVEVTIPFHTPITSTRTSMPRVCACCRISRSVPCLSALPVRTSVYDPVSKSGPQTHAEWTVQALPPATVHRTDTLPDHF